VHAAAGGESVWLQARLACGEHATAVGWPAAELARGVVGWRAVGLAP
jgi:hypothetical protein